jgi:AbiU2
MLEKLKRPPIGQRSTICAQETLHVTQHDEVPLEGQLKKIDELVEKILDQLIEVQATILLFQEPNRWVQAMQARGIATGSSFSWYLQKSIVIASMQSLCRLWDKPKNGTQICFKNLRKLLNDQTMDRVLNRSLANLRCHYAESPHYIESDSRKFVALRASICPKLDELYDFFNGNTPSSIPASKLRTTRDKWISHNDDDFDAAFVDLALKELGPFFEKTKECFEGINHFVRDSGFSWESLSHPMSRDIDLFLGPPKAPAPSSSS